MFEENSWFCWDETCLPLKTAPEAHLPNLNGFSHRRERRPTGPFTDLPRSLWGLLLMAACTYAFRHGLMEGIDWILCLGRKETRGWFLDKNILEMVLLGFKSPTSKYFQVTWERETMRNLWQAVETTILFWININHGQLSTTGNVPQTLCHRNQRWKHRCQKPKNRKTKVVSD